MKKSNDIEGVTNVLVIHFIYVVIILVGLIILLAAKNWTGLQGFTDYLSVAATITSLVLGILAIIYSFVSSNSTNSSLGSIESAAHDIRSIGSDLGRVVSEGQQLQMQAETRNQEFHQLIGDLRSAVDGLSNTTTAMAGSLEGLPSKVREEMRQAAQTETGERPKEDLRSLWTGGTLRSYLSNTSMYGIVAIKAFSDAATVGKYCDMKILFEDSLSSGLNYAHGFLVASASAGLFRYEVADGSLMTASPTRLRDSSPELTEAIENEWNKRLNSSTPSKKRSALKYAPKIEKSIVSFDANS